MTTLSLCGYIAGMAGSKVSRSSIALDGLLRAGGEVAERIEERFHRTLLWRYRTGAGKPSAPQAAELQELSGGVVMADGWRDLTAASPPDHTDPAEPAPESPTEAT